MNSVSHDRSITIEEAISLDFLGQPVKFKNPHTSLISVTCRRENWDDWGNRIFDRHTYPLKS